MEERTSAKKLTSLAKLFEIKFNDMTKGMGAKEVGETQKAEREKLKESIRKECKLENARLKVLALAKDVNGYWKLWSKTVERGWLRYADEEKAHDKTATGRGKVELIKTKKNSRRAEARRPKRPT